MVQAVKHYNNDQDGYLISHLTLSDGRVPLKKDGSPITDDQHMSTIALAALMTEGGHYRNEDHIKKYLNIEDITKAGYFRRVGDAFKIDAYHAVAFLRNGARFVGYFLASIVATLCLVAVALNKQPACTSNDYSKMYRRCWKNLTFMGHNLAMIGKHAVAAIPIVSHIAIALYNKYHKPSVNVVQEEGLLPFEI